MKSAWTACCWWTCIPCTPSRSSRYSRERSSLCMHQQGPVQTRLDQPVGGDHVCMSSTACRCCPADPGSASVVPGGEAPVSHGHWGPQGGLQRVWPAERCLLHPHGPPHAAPLVPPAHRQPGGAAAPRTHVYASSPPCSRLHAGNLCLAILTLASCPVALMTGSTCTEQNAQVQAWRICLHGAQLKLPLCVELHTQGANGWGSQNPRTHAPFLPCSVTPAKHLWLGAGYCRQACCHSDSAGQQAADAAAA